MRQPCTGSWAGWAPGSSRGQAVAGTVVGYPDWLRPAGRQQLKMLEPDEQRTGETIDWTHPAHSQRYAIVRVQVSLTIIIIKELHRCHRPGWVPAKRHSAILIDGAGRIMFSGCPSICVHACMPGWRHSLTNLLLTYCWHCRLLAFETSEVLVSVSQRKKTSASLSKVK